MSDSTAFDRTLVPRGEHDHLGFDLSPCAARVAASRGSLARYYARRALGWGALLAILFICGSDRHIQFCDPDPRASVNRCPTAGAGGGGAGGGEAGGAGAGGAGAPGVGGFGGIGGFGGLAGSAGSAGAPVSGGSGGGFPEADASVPADAGDDAGLDAGG
jgi:hypothetical protein